MKTVMGKGGISATVIADSVCNGIRMVTMELEYPRFFHSEVMTHRMLSKNAASSRAIPGKAMMAHIKENTARPIFWGKNQPGMKARESLNPLEIESSIGVWDAARDMAISHAEIMNDIGNHKQVSNRIVEPFMMMKTVMSGTEWANLLWLRDHEDAQPEFKELAHCIATAQEMSTPNQLKPGEWHLPYVNSVRVDGKMTYWVDEEVSLENARKVSASCCAQVSYRKLDDSLEKALKVFDMLNLGTGSGQPAHASPVEHQATPMLATEYQTCFGWEEGVTHVDREGHAWSGNLRGWVQFRKLIPNEAVW
jgi:hypothetical protein